jgi:hypothetical protein
MTRTHDKMPAIKGGSADLPIVLEMSVHVVFRLVFFQFSSFVFQNQYIQPTRKSEFFSLSTCFKVHLREKNLNLP